MAGTVRRSRYLALFLFAASAWPGSSAADPASITLLFQSSDIYVDSLETSVRLALDATLTDKSAGWSGGTFTVDDVSQLIYSSPVGRYGTRRTTMEVEVVFRHSMSHATVQTASSNIRWASTRSSVESGFSVGNVDLKLMGIFSMYLPGSALAKAEGVPARVGTTRNTQQPTPPPPSPSAEAVDLQRGSNSDAAVDAQIRLVGASVRVMWEGVEYIATIKRVYTDPTVYDGSYTFYDVVYVADESVGEYLTVEEHGLSLLAKTCESLGWNPVINGICGASDQGLGTDSGTVCTAQATYQAADLTCAAAGARLCTTAEINSKVTKGTGCNFDVSNVWTSNSCGLDAYTAANGGGNGVTVCASSASYRAVRCCADAAAYSSSASMSSSSLSSARGAAAANTYHEAARNGGDPQASLAPADPTIVTYTPSPSVGDRVEVLWNDGRTYTGTVLTKHKELEGYSMRRFFSVGFDDGSDVGTYLTVQEHKLTVVPPGAAHAYHVYGKGSKGSDTYRVESEPSTFVLNPFVKTPFTPRLTLSVQSTDIKVSELHASAKAALDVSLLRLSVLWSDEVLSMDDFLGVTYSSHEHRYGARRATMEVELAFKRSITAETVSRAAANIEANVPDQHGVDISVSNIDLTILGIYEQKGVAAAAGPLASLSGHGKESSTEGKAGKEVKEGKVATKDGTDGGGKRDTDSNRPEVGHMRMHETTATHPHQKRSKATGKQIVALLGITLGAATVMALFAFGRKRLAAVGASASSQVCKGENEGGGSVLDLLMPKRGAPQTPEVEQGEMAEGKDDMVKEVHI